jgi:hypothetical protein
MKKSNIKLSLNKKNISNLETSTIIGGVSGGTCEYTNKYYRTCWSIIQMSTVCNTAFICEG